MFGSAFGVLAAAACVSLVRGQANWAANQVNTTLCEWRQFRAHVIRDTVYLDGGSTWWMPGFSDGNIGPVENDLNPMGLIYTLNFSRPFQTSDNITSKFEILPKPNSNIAPTYFDGAMLGNHDQWFLYGGTLRLTSSTADPPADRLVGFRKHSYGADKPLFRPGIVEAILPANMTRYLAYGGAASAPSENKAWYFSGMRSPEFSSIYDLVDEPSMTAGVASNTLITLDMTTQMDEKWTNKTLPSKIPGRAGSELVWVPVGAQGILVALGGVLFPEFINSSAVSDNEAASKASSPSFMSTIDIYDVAKDEWHRQPTVGGPGQLTRGCAVVVPAKDRSSFSIYYYGGYAGLKASDPFSDDVWVLSIPSFTWVKLLPGGSEGRVGRAGHKCFMPYPDQMFVIGGYQQATGKSIQCLKETIRVFNVSTGKWLTSYDPSKWSEYSIPDAVVAKIGGSATGGATVTTPSPSGWATPALASIFSVEYPQTKIQNYWPYQSVDPGNNTNPTVPTDKKEEGGGGGVPAFLPPVLGVVLGLMFVTMIAVLVLLWRRRRLFRSRGGMSEAGTEDTNGHRIMSWMRGQQAVENKAPTVTSDETPSSPGDFESVTSHPLSMAEMMNTEVERPPVELMDTSRASELHDTGLTHVDVMNRYSRDNRGSLNNGSYYSSGTHQIDHASSVSPSSPSVTANIGGYQTPQPQELAHSPDPTISNPESLNNPPSATQPPAPRGYIPSGVSGISERDRAHLRTISDTTVSSVTSGPADRNFRSPEPGSGEAAQQPHSHRHESIDALSPVAEGTGTLPTAVSPPSAEQVEGGDYLSARPLGQSSATSPTSPLRRSVFHESREDMNGGYDDGGYGRR